MRRIFERIWIIIKNLLCFIYLFNVLQKLTVTPSWPFVWVCVSLRNLVVAPYRSIQGRIRAAPLLATIVWHSLFMVCISMINITDILFLDTIGFLETDYSLITSTASIPGNPTPPSLHNALPYGTVTLFCDFWLDVLIVVRPGINAVPSQVLDLQIFSW